MQLLPSRRFNTEDGKFFPDAQTARLYELLSAGGFRTDQEVAAALGVTDLSDYRKARQRLKRLLYRQLLISDLSKPHYQARQRAYFECQRNWAVVRLLLGRNARHSALELAADLLQLSLRYDFTEISLDISRSMRLQYGTVMHDLKKYEQLNLRVMHLEKVVEAEYLSEALYTDLTARFVNNRSSNTAIHRMATEYFDRLSGYLSDYNTYRLHLCARLIEVLIYSSIGDYRGMLTACQRAITFFESRPYVANVPLQAFYYQGMIGCLQLRDYALGADIAARGRALLDEGTFNWFKYQELLLFLFLHTRLYAESHRVFLSVVAHRNYVSLPERSRQLWKILEAYQYYLLDLGLIVAEGDDSVLSRFKIARFANETPLYSKDRQGVNIPVLIFQVVYLVRKRRFQDVIDRLEALKRYSSRYLKKGDAYRSQVFIKMLQVLPETGFNRKASVRHAEKYVKMLADYPLDFAAQSHEVEMIPYEDLWEMVLDSLTAKKP